MQDESHLRALELNLSNARMRLRDSKTKEEKSLRQVWCDQLEREILSERRFLGIADPIEVSVDVDDESLLEMLGA